MHLRFIVGLVIGLIALAVGFACLGVTLTFTYDTIYQVGSRWAVQMATAASNSVKYYLDNRVEATLAGAAKAGRHYTPRVGSDLAKIDGKNWTDFWKVQMMQTGSKYSYDFVAYGMFMEDLNWMFVARSGVAPGDAVRIEWIEPKVPYDANGGATFGGYRYFIGNGSEYPYDNRTTGFQTEFFALDGGNLFHQASPGFSIVRQSLKARIGMTDPPMFAAPLDATYITATNSYFIWSFLAGIVNSSGSLVGILAMSLGLESTITDMLKDAPHSRGGYNFLSDSQGYLIGSTHPVPFVNISITALNAVAPNPGCSNTASLNPQIQPPRMNCRAFYSNFPYPPLQQLSKSAALTNSLTSTTISTDDDDYIVVTNRITTNTAREKIQIFSVVPVSDLLGGVKRGRDIAIGVAAAIMVMTIAVAVGIMSSILQPLEEVSEKMIAMARLEGLEPVDKMNMNDEEEKNTNNNNNGRDGDGIRMLSQQEQEDIEDAKVKKLSTLNKNNKNKQKNKTSQINSKESGEEDPLNTTTTNANLENINNGSGDNNNSNTSNISWISEIANLQRSYTEAKTAMTNFTRYVSRAVVSELLIQRGIVSQGGASATSTPKLQVPRSGAEMAAIAARNLATLNDQEVAPTTFNFDYDVTVLISEIEGFSQLWAANSTPDQHDVVLYVLHIYFKRMTRLIMGHGGIVDKFMGDSIMSYWGAPIRTEHHALLAVLCSLSLLRESRRDPLKKLFGETLRRPLRLRSGISTGAAFVGTVGSAQSVSYSVIGRPVATAKHLQDFTRYWNTSILMDSATMLKVDDAIVHRLLCSAIFDEGAKPVTAYEVVGLNPEGKLLYERVTSKRMAIAASATEMTTMLNSDGSLVSLPPQQQSSQSRNANNNHQLHPSAEPSSNNNNNNNDHNSTINQSSENLLSHSSSYSSAATQQHQQQQRDFGETVAFTDVLSVATLGSNEGVEELLRAMNPDQSSLDNLLRWHSTRCVVTTPGYVYFAEQYSECARLCIECKFAASMALWTDIVANEAGIPKDRRKDVSMDILATMNRLYLTSPPPKESLSEEDGTFVIRVYRFQALMAQDRNKNNNHNNNNKKARNSSGSGSARRKSSSSNNSRTANSGNSQQQNNNVSSSRSPTSASSQKNTVVHQQQQQQQNQENIQASHLLETSSKKTPSNISNEAGYTDLMVRNSKNSSNNNDDADRTSSNTNVNAINNRNELMSASAGVIQANSIHNNDVDTAHRTAQNDITTAAATHCYSENNNNSTSNGHTNNNNHVGMNDVARDLSMTSNNMPHQVVDADIHISIHKQQ